jgi:hypothetical protein
VPTQKKTNKKKKEKEESLVTNARKWKALFLLALGALGYGFGKGAVEAIVDRQRDVPSVSAPAHPEKQLDQKTPQSERPDGREPTQRLRFVYVNGKGEEKTFFYDASVRSLTWATYDWASKPKSAQTFAPPKQGEDRLVINAQLHPSAPVINVEVSKKDIANQLATLGDSSLSPKDLASVKHITIAPESDPDKPTKA